MRVHDKLPRCFACALCWLRRSNRALAGWSLRASRAGACRRFARKKYDEAFSGNGAAYKYRVNMQL
jgi:hypothetical protein